METTDPALPSGGDGITGGMQLPIQLRQDDSARRRLYMMALLFAFAMVVIWWQTTSVSRAKLVSIGIAGGSEGEVDGPMEVARHMELQVTLVMEQIPEDWKTYLNWDGSNGPFKVHPNQDRVDRERFLYTDTVLCKVRHHEDMERIKGQLRHVDGFDAIEELLVESERRQYRNSDIDDGANSRKNKNSHHDDLTTYQMYVIDYGLVQGGGEGGKGQVFKEHLQISENKANIFLGKRSRTILVLFPPKENYQPEVGQFLERTMTQLLDLLNPPIDPVALSWEEHIIPDAPAYQITITLLVGQSTDPTIPMQHVDWKIEEASQLYLQPIINRLRLVADIRLHFQVRPHAMMTAELEGDLSKENNVLREVQLPTFVRENSWNIASPLTNHAPIDLLLFIPPIALQPMSIVTSANSNRSQFWGYKQWGGVYILNPSKGHAGIVLSVQDLRPVMAAFAGQLRRLFGVNMNESEELDDTTTIWLNPSSAQMAPTSSIGITMLELDALYSRRTSGKLLAAESTLRALGRLLEQNGEITVLPTIEHFLERATKAIKQSKQYLIRARWRHAYEASVRAVQWSEMAFFHPTMMAQQYFPQEHKIGVYMPFFLFVLPVLVAALANLISHLKGRRRAGGENPPTQKANS